MEKNKAIKLCCQVLLIKALSYHVISTIILLRINHQWTLLHRIFEIIYMVLKIYKQLYSIITRFSFIIKRAHFTHNSTKPLEAGVWPDWLIMAGLTVIWPDWLLFGQTGVWPFFGFWLGQRLTVFAGSQTLRRRTLRRRILLRNLTYLQLYGTTL